MLVDGGPLGSYRAGATALHRLDARVKVTLLFVWTAAVLSMASWWMLAAAVAGVLCAVQAAGIEVSRAVRSLAPVALVLLVILVANSLRFDGTGGWGLWGDLGVSPEGLEGGGKIVVRIGLMVLLSLLVTATTSAAQLMEAFLSLTGPLRRFGVPVDDVATMLSIALRFIPVCGEQLERVAMAQRARGARVGQGGPVARVTSWVPVMIPVFVGLFRRSDALSNAMVARCYRGKGRTCLTTSRMGATDVAVLVVGLAAAVAVWVLG